MSQERMNMSTYQKTALGTTMAGLGMQSCSTMLLSYVLTSIIADFVNQLNCRWSDIHHHQSGNAGRWYHLWNIGRQVWQSKNFCNYSRYFLYSDRADSLFYKHNCHLCAALFGRCRRRRRVWCDYVHHCGFFR